MGHAMVITQKKKLDLTKIDVSKFSFTRYYDQVLIHGEDASGNQFELMLGSDATALIRQATHNLITQKLSVA